MAITTLQRRQFPLLAAVLQLLFTVLFALFSRVEAPGDGVDLLKIGVEIFGI